MGFERIRPFDLNALADYLRAARLGEQDGWFQTALPEIISERIGIHRQWAYRHPYLDVFEADRLAVAFGEHPSTIWPNWWEEALSGRFETCSRGHDVTEENTYTSTDGFRHCRACQRVQAAKKRERYRQMQLR
jgi:hypothetical protein